jgi:methionine synthase II (cobalamin-independent)
LAAAGCGGGTAATVRNAVMGVVQKQVEIGIDVPSDGEYGKPSFSGYVNERLGGFERRPRDIPGVVAHTTNIVEHPELIAWRLMTYARLVGRENVMAGTDCGFSQGAFTPRVHASIMWAKLQSLAEGAALAAKQLWSRTSR